MDKETIRDFGGRIIGYKIYKPNGDIQIRDFYGRLLGTYRKSDNTTRDFYNRIVARGDQTSMLLGRVK